VNPRGRANQHTSKEVIITTACLGLGQVQAADDFFADCLSKCTHGVWENPCYLPQEEYTVAKTGKLNHSCDGQTNSRYSGCKHAAQPVLLHRLSKCRWIREQLQVACTVSGYCICQLLLLHLAGAISCAQRMADPAARAAGCCSSTGR
jgi:hypothetical protein